MYLHLSWDDCVCVCVCNDYCTKTTNYIILQRGWVIVSLSIEKYEFSICGLVCQYCGCHGYCLSSEWLQQALVSCLLLGCCPWCVFPILSRSVCRRKTVRSFLRNIPCQQCCVGDRYTGRWKNFLFTAGRFKIWKLYYSSCMRHGLC